jgi:phosphoglucosamine mutase
VQVIHNNPNGLNINDRCGSQHTQDLKKRVVESGASIGLAFDGDGDRLIAVDEKGREISGDQVLLICAKQIKEKGRLKNDLLISTVMSNLGLKVACKRYGIKHHASKVGDRHVLEDMFRLGSVIGGEDAGHMIFLEHHSTGDGMISAIQLIAAMIESGKPLSELAGLMEIYPQKLINVDVTAKPEFSTLPQVMEAIRQAEAELGENGRVLVRYSGTQNMCRVMVEGPTIEITERYCRQIADEIRSTIG